MYDSPFCLNHRFCPQSKNCLLLLLPIINEDFTSSITKKLEGMETKERATHIQKEKENMYFF